MESRRSFAQKMLFTAFASLPTIDALSKLLNILPKSLEEAMISTDFHYFDNNLTNLHFYFINAEIKVDCIVKSEVTPKSYMIVKLPQQHISELLLRNTKFETEYLNTNKRTTSEISGFSFLAFELFPEPVKPTAKGKKVTYIDLSKIENLLAWNNPLYYKLIIPNEDAYIKFKKPKWSDFKTGDEARIVDVNKKPTKGYIIKLYQSICEKLFKDGNYPMTLLEIPEGLLLSPYNKEGTRTYMETYRIPKKRFLYNNANRKVTRTVEEIWSAQMFFETADGIKSPSLRAVGFLPRGINEDERSKDECPEEDIKYLPTLLDKNELVFLTSLGRDLNSDNEWNIETKGLTFTGLGAITKIHYKNFSPPDGTDLAEYEHHITMGRDEYIKVARIGVISVTGQKALHVYIGERKIRNGISYMEFYEYIEIIQKELTYFDNNLFIPGDLDPKEPQNFIHARKYPPVYYTYTDNRKPKKPDAIIHSIDLLDKETDNTYRDSVIWNLKNYLPEHPYTDGQKNWHTNYKRWPFKKVKSVTFITPRINSTDPEARSYAAPGCDCATFFWPVKENQIKDADNDCYLDFIGFDWNDKEIKFSSTFLFIRKKIIECQTGEQKIYENLYSDIKLGFINQKFERRSIRFIDQDIAFTPDFIPTDPEIKGSLPNKTNIAKTDFLEYYFSICLEPTRSVKTEGGTVLIPSSAEIALGQSSIFNERAFPLYPQAKKAQLYVENIQSYTSEPLASIVEYNDDFINYGYAGKVRDKSGKPLIRINEKGQPVENIYNKARLIFNHTDNFIKNGETVLENINGKWQEKADSGYKKIKDAFGGAGEAIGGMVNPDFDIQSIGLVKQSIAVGRDINKKYENAVNIVDEIKEFNPSDLLRQAPEIFNGISLLDILQEVFPNYEAPLNEIKNIGSKIEAIRAEFLNNPIYLEIEGNLHTINDTIKKYLDDIETISNTVTTYQNTLKEYKDRFNIDYLASEIEKLVESSVAKYKIRFLEIQNGIVTFGATQMDEIVNYLTAELISRTEAIYPYYQALKDAKKSFDTLAKTPKLGPEATTLINNFAKNFLSDDQILINLAAPKKDTILREYAEVNLSIKNKVTDFYKLYKKYSEDIGKETTAYNLYIQQQTSVNYNKYLALKKIALDSKEKYDNEIEKVQSAKSDIFNLLSELKKYPKDFALIKEYEPVIASVQKSVFKLTEILETINLPYYINMYDKATKDINTFKSKLKPNEFLLGDAIDSIIARVDNKTLIDSKTFSDSIQEKRKELEAFYLKEIQITPTLKKLNFNYLKDNFDTLVLESKTSIAAYTKSIGIDRIEEIMKIPQAGFFDFKEKIRIMEGDLNAAIKNQINALKVFEEFTKNQIAAGKNIVDLVFQKIKDKENELLNDPTNKDLVSAVIKGKELYNILSSLSQKEINYNWQTSSFKNADFGIVTFLASENPKTSLSVKVKNTISFQPNKFPAVISKVESSAENRLNNFGISLLKAIIINFNEVSFVAGTNQKSKFEVKIRDVQFAGAFSFVQALEALFKKLLGDNFSVRISPQNVEIQYLLPIAYAGAPSFGFKDILFKIVYTLYFDKKPMELGVGIGTPENRTKLSVGIYTGLFYFIVIGNPKEGITTIEVSIEFGGYFGLNLGPLRGEVKLVVGLYYKKDRTGVVIEGYFLCEGRVKLWFIMITARFYMGVRSQGAYVEGRCTVSYEIRLGRFFKRSFSATYYKKLAGATPGNNQSGSMLLAVQKYNSLKPRAEDVHDKTKYLDAVKKITNPVERKVKPLTRLQWEIFINSYTD